MSSLELIWHQLDPLRAVQGDGERESAVGSHRGGTEPPAVTSRAYTAHTNGCTAQPGTGGGRCTEFQGSGGAWRQGCKESTVVGGCQPSLWPNSCPVIPCGAPAQWPRETPAQKALGLLLNAVGHALTRPPSVRLAARPGEVGVKLDQVPSHCSRPPGRLCRAENPRT